MSLVNKSAWIWYGVLCEGTELRKYNAMVMSEGKDATSELVIRLCDGQNSFIGATTNALMCSAEETSIAAMDPQKRLEKVRAIFHDIGKTSGGQGSVRILAESSPNCRSYSVRISALWGIEFGLEDMLLDIAAIPLERSPTIENFLDFAFSELRRNRQALEQMRLQTKAVAIEVEDLAEAQACFELMNSETRRTKQMQACVDVLNEYKSFCRTRAAEQRMLKH